MTNRINAQAVAEYIKDDQWLVQVWTDDLPTQEYIIDAETEKQAAFAAIDKFVEDHQDG